jgi:cytoskeletal protein CcmA (bactofilin family)
MALFSKKKPAQEPRQQVQEELRKEAEKASKEVISSIISKDMQIIGEIIFKGKVRIDGLVEGAVKGEHLVLSEAGCIKGDIDVASLKCHGNIKGNVTGKLVNALSTAVIDGKLIADDFNIESGATLYGEIQSRNRKDQPVADPNETAAKKQDKNAPLKANTTIADMMAAAKKK